MADQKIAAGLTSTGRTVPLRVDSTGRLQTSGPLQIQGNWNASTNTPTLVSSVGTAGHFYVVSVAGSTNLNGVTTWNIGDWAVFGGGVWFKADHSASATDNQIAVPSINGNGFAITLGEKGNQRVPFTGTITDWVITEALGNSTTTSVQIWKDTQANYPPAVADLILTMTLSAEIINSATGLSIAVTKGDFIRASVTVNDNAKLIQGWMQVTVPANS